MCGLAGFIDTNTAHDTAAHVLGRMLDRIRHRGPDDEGTWSEGPVSIGHRRLAIVDLSPMGHQPMPSRSGRYLLAYNGEIYNHEALRDELRAQGVTFRGHSDTEVLLALIESSGLVAALKRCVGMFAIALWDREASTLLLARDRFGEKPLYCGWQRGVFLFASELKALCAHPSFERRVDRDSVAQMMRYGYVPAPFSIYQGIQKVPPGSVLTLAIDKATGAPRGPAHTDAYWTHEEAFARGAAQPFEGSFADAAAATEALLSDAIGRQMLADVPLGAMLSGGVDSSVVVALMQKLSPQPVRTYCIGFESASLDEAPHARAVALHLGTTHTEAYVSSADAKALIPELPRLYDEPLGDASQIPTCLLARIVRREVTVALSGDGGDELFAGYPKYARGERDSRLPGRHLWAGVLGAIPWQATERVATALPGRWARKVTAARLQYLHARLSHRTPQALVETSALVSLLDAQLVPGSNRRRSAFDAHRPDALLHPYRRLAMLVDQETYLPDDVLTKVDRATMAASLESRAPLLDHRLAELAARFPLEYLAGPGSSTKRVLRDVLYRHVPRALVDRPKQGFSAPVSEWLRQDLHGWARALFQDSRHGDLLDRGLCLRLLETHRRGRDDLSGVLWSALSCLAWAEEWL